MSNIYTQGAFAFEADADEANALITLMKALDTHLTGDGDGWKELLSSYGLDALDEDDACDLQGHHIEILKNPFFVATEVYISNTENFSPRVLNIVIAKLFPKTLKRGAITYYYARSGDKARPGTFSGGAGYISKDGHDYQSTYTLLNLMMAHRENAEDHLDNGTDRG